MPSVSIQNALDTVDFGLFEATVERETVIDLPFTEEKGDAAKSEHWELLEMVVGLENGSHFLDGSFVLICNATGIVQALWVCDFAVRSREVYRHGERHLPARTKVFREVWVLRVLKVRQVNFAAFFSVFVKFELQGLILLQILDSCIGIADSFTVNYNNEPNRHSLIRVTDLLQL